MPFVFIIVGAIMVISGSRGTSATLVSLLKGDLTGKDNFTYWILSILVIGSLGYVQDFKSLSRAFLALILIVLVIAEDKNGSGGLFSTFQSAFQSITGNVSSTSISTPTVSTSTGSSSNSTDLFGDDFLNMTSAQSAAYLNSLGLNPRP